MGRTRFFFFFKLYLLKLMKMAYGSLSMSETRHFNLILNIAIAYNYEYIGGIIFFFGEYKLKINKW